MEIITEEKDTRKTLKSDDPQTTLKPSLEETETVGNDLGSEVVTTTVVEETEVSVVKMVQQEEGEGLFGNLVDEDEGLKVNRSENGASVVMDGENGSYISSVFGHEENASADPMDICLSEKNEKNGDNGDEIVELKEDVNKTDEEKVVNGEDDNGKELADDDEEKDNNFVVGDFVWGKIKSHPWWPGQIYDPSDASDHAASLKHKGEHLVAYFGDRSFSWCSQSQLKPFIDNFQEMSSQSDSRKFVNAVQKVLKEVGRRVEAELMSKWRSVNTEKAGVVNSGIKKGTRAPKGNTVKVLIDRIEPAELVSTLKGYATMEPGARLVELELIVLKSCLSAFYTKKGGNDYPDSNCIEGLEEETKRAVVSPEDGDDKLYQRRKQKSVAELMGEDDSKVKKAKRTKDGGMKNRKRKALVVSVTPESDHESGGGGGGGFEEEIISPRQRKKSKYLSPPYLSPVGIEKFSVLGSGSFKEPKTEHEKVPETAAKQLEDSLKKISGKKAQEHKKADAAGSVATVLDGLLRAALDPSSFVQKEKNLQTIMELVSSFRGSIFKEGSCNQTDKKKDGEDASELAFIKQKLEWMSEMVQMCEESEMSADVKTSLEGGLQEVLGKVVKIKGK